MSTAGGAIVAISIAIIVLGWIDPTRDFKIIKIFAGILGAAASFGYLSRQGNQIIKAGGA